MRHDLLLVMWKGQAQRVQLRQQVTGGEDHPGCIAERTRIARGPSRISLVLRLSETTKPSLLGLENGDFVRLL